MREVEAVARAMRIASLRMSGYSPDDAAQIAEKLGYDQRDFAAAQAAIAALDAARGETADERREPTPEEHALMIGGMDRDFRRVAELGETADERQAAIVAGFRKLQAAGETWVREDEACGWAADWIESGEWRR